MGFHKIAGEPNYFLNLLTKTENASANDIKLAHDQFDGKDRNEILSISGDTAIISIVGPLSPDGPSPIARFFGFEGTAYNDIIAAVDEILANEDVKKTRLAMDTPGGAVSGMDLASQAIGKLKSKMMVVAENHGMIASAGYIIAARSSRIVSLSDLHLTGSIGVMTIGFDDREFLKNQGIKRITLRSANAPDKSPDFETQKELKIIQDQIDALERNFISIIAQGRSLSMDFVSENFGRGRMLVARDPDPEKNSALKIKMIDSIDLNLKTSENTNNEDIDFNFSQSKILTNNLEAKNMDIIELLAKNPEAKVSYDKVIALAVKEGITLSVGDGKKKMTELCAKVKPFLELKSEYPDNIRALALGCLSGENTAESFEASVSAHDQALEGINSQNASGGDGGDTGDVGGDANLNGGDSQCINGEIKTNDDFASEVKRSKELLGQSVK